MPVIERGEGRPVLFLHGYGSKKESFYYQIQALAAHFKVVVPDMPGFGASAPLKEAWSVGDYARWTEQFVRAKKLVRPHIVAHSFGARVAFKLLDGRADAFGKLVITGGAGLVKERSRAYMRRVNAYRRVKKWFPNLAERAFGSKEYRTLSPTMKQSYKKIVNEDLSACAARIANPTLLIYGAEDRVTPASEEGETFHRLIGGSTLEIIGGGHFCFCENAPLFNRLIYEFLTENG